MVTGLSVICWYYVIDFNLPLVSAICLLVSQSLSASFESCPDRMGSTKPVVVSARRLYRNLRQLQYLPSAAGATLQNRIVMPISNPIQRPSVQRWRQPRITDWKWRKFRIRLTASHLYTDSGSLSPSTRPSKRLLVDPEFLKVPPWGLVQRDTFGLCSLCCLTNSMSASVGRKFNQLATSIRRYFSDDPVNCRLDDGVKLEWNWGFQHHGPSFSN